MKSTFFFFFIYTIFGHNHLSRVRIFRISERDLFETHPSGLCAPVARGILLAFSSEGYRSFAGFIFHGTEWFAEHCQKNRTVSSGDFFDFNPPGNHFFFFVTIRTGLQVFHRKNRIAERISSISVDVTKTGNDTIFNWVRSHYHTRWANCIKTRCCHEIASGKNIWRNANNFFLIGPRTL